VAIGLGAVLHPRPARDGRVAVLPSVEGRCSAVTVNRKLSAVSALYQHSARHGVELGDLLRSWQPAGRRGSSWRPFLHHISKGQPAARRAVGLKTARKHPRVLTVAEVQTILDACVRLRDRFLFAVLYDSDDQPRQHTVLCRTKKLTEVTTANRCIDAQWWICGVDPGCTKPGVDAPAVVRTISAITTRLLDAYAQGPAGGQHPGVDNLQQLHIPRCRRPDTRCAAQRSRTPLNPKRTLIPYRCSRLPRCSSRALFSVAYIAERDRPLMSISCAALYSPDS